MMATDERFDETISRWLEQTAPPRLPERVLEATFERTRRSRQQFGWRALLGRPHLTRSVFALGGAAAVVMVAALALNFYPNLPGLGGPVPVADPRDPFLGTWLSTGDTDGGTQTMTVRVAADGGVEITVLDDVATVCSGTSSTMMGTGRIEAGTRLVIPAPVYTCDDGSAPETLSGPPLQEQLRDWTLVLDPQTDTLSDGFGGLWLRDGAGAPSPDPAISGGMWPQTSLAEVRQAQEAADAGDPAYTWQVDPQLSSEEWWVYLRGGGAEIVQRFLQEELGWDHAQFNPFTEDGGGDGVITRLVYLRCAPGETNPLYPIPGQFDAEGGDRCAPTIDELRYETVSLDLAQLDRRGSAGIWVVSRWATAAPFAQADPAVVEAQATERLEGLLAARIAGNGAEGYVQVVDAETVPLLYATTSGAPYERYEIERVDGPGWPNGNGTFRVRLFADGDATVIEEIWSFWDDGLWLDALATTENGQPFVRSYTSSDGDVTVSAPSTWAMLWPGEAAHEFAPDVWFGLLWDPVPYPDPESGESIGLVDPVAYDAYCAANGGSPLLSAPADAAAIAQQLIADPNFETTAPVAAQVGGVEAVSIDVALAPGGRPCSTLGGIEISRWVHSLQPGLRLRLYLVDLPQGMSVQTLAITVVAPADSFEQFIAETAPIIESIEFHPG